MQDTEKLIIKENNSMDIFEELDKKFALNNKVQNLSKLIIEESYFSFDDYYYVSFERFFDYSYFKQWKYSFGCNNLEEFKTKLGFCYNSDGFFPFNDIDAIRFLQYSYNATSFVQDCLEKDNGCLNCEQTKFMNNFTVVFNYIMSKINQEIIKHPTEDYSLIVPCNDKTKRCADLQTNKNVGFFLYEYNSLLVKGNIDKKRSILRELSHTIEPIISLNVQKFSSGPVREIFDHLGSIFNNFNIRHNNSDPSCKSNYKPELDNFNKTDYEEIYDTCYDLILDSILLDEYTKKTKLSYDKFIKKIGK